MAAPTSLTTNQRHHFVDALRGFALLGILIVNIEYIVQPASLGWSEYDSTGEQIARWFVISFGQTKVYPIFAALFGYGLSLQFERAKNADPIAGQTAVAELARRTRRRNIALFVAGIIHGIAFFPGDILTIYAIVGAACFRLLPWPTTKLLKLAAWVYGLASAAWLMLGVLDSLGGGSSITTTPDPANVEALTNGSFLDSVGVLFPAWIETVLFLMVIQGPAVVASFAVGIVLGRGDLLANPTKNAERTRQLLRQWAPVAFGVAGVAGWASLDSIRTETFGFALGFAIAPLLSACYIGLLGLAIGGRRNLVALVLQMAGSMSLTVYLGESVVTAFLSYGYGFGWIGKVGPGAGVALAFAIWLGLALAARLWMTRFRFGPCEWLLRSITYGTRQSIQR